MGNNPVKFSYKQIWFIAYPILISLVMEQLIGMTDTAFMGRVGEVELGASAIAGVYYMTFYMIAFGSANHYGAEKRRRKLCEDRPDIL